MPQGCTGLWQVGAHTDLLPHQAPEYDYYYLTNWSLGLDLWIMWRTLLKMLRIGGPVHLDQLPAFLTREQPNLAPVLNLVPDLPEPLDEIDDWSETGSVGEEGADQRVAAVLRADNGVTHRRHRLRAR